MIPGYSKEFPVKQASFYTFHSKDVTHFYKGVMKELSFNLHNGHVDSIPKSNSLTGSNTSTTSELSYRFSPWQIQLKKWSLSPLFSTGFSHKRLRYQVLDNSGFFSHYYYRDIRLSRVVLGTSPEFSRPIPSPNTQNRISFVFRPILNVVQHIYYGTLDKTYFLSGQVGTELIIESTRYHDTQGLFRGVGFGFSGLYNRTLLGTHELSTTYAHILERVVTYPKSSVQVGVSIIYTVRAKN